MPNRTTAPRRQPQPGERLFEFLRGHDRFLCEPRDHGAYGIEAEFWDNEEFRYGAGDACLRSAHPIEFRRVAGLLRQRFAQHFECEVVPSW